MFEGIDVSNHNGSVDWRRVRAAGISFAHAKTSEGTGYADPFFEPNRKGAAANRIHFGGYHFAQPDQHPGVSGAVAEATYFVGLLGKVKPGDLRPVLDLEVGSGNLTAWAGAFLARVEKLTGVRPLLYTYTSFAKAHLNMRVLSGYGLWVADYGPNDGKEHPVSITNIEHQYTSRAVIGGVVGSVDRNSAGSLGPIVVPTPPAPAPAPGPRPEPKHDVPFINKVWPIPLPQWFWAWASWRKSGKFGPRPAAAPSVIPPWAWIRLAQL